MRDGLLDMRMNQTQFLTAFNVVNEYTEYELSRLIYNYGEESFAKNIVNNHNGQIKTFSKDNFTTFRVIFKQK